MVKSGELAPCEFINVESEFAAMSVAIGASAAGARAFTATASQGLLFMMEAVYNAGGLGLPIVMTLANRAVGAPINIWNDHSDAMAARDAGWVQLFAETNQEAADLHIQAFRLAEELSVPVMVCMDGFILTHATERVDIPTQDQVDAFLPPYEPRQVLDPDDPVSIGAMVGPEAFEEVRYLAHARQLQALEPHPELGEEFAEAFGRDSGGLVHPYRSADAETWSWSPWARCSGRSRTSSTPCATQATRIGALGIALVPPLPDRRGARALEGARRVVVVEKAFSVGFGGVLVDRRRHGADRPPVPVATVMAGLGGRPITKASLRRRSSRLPPRESSSRLTFLDLDRGLVERELARMAHRRRSGPTAENMLRDLGRRSGRGSA